VVHAHPFGGFFGKVESVEGKDVVTALIELFGRLTPVEFQSDEIERVGRGGRRPAALLDPTGGAAAGGGIR
jgi:hypothetical protein